MNFSLISGLDLFWLDVLKQLDLKSRISFAASCDVFENIYAMNSNLRLSRVVDLEEMLEFSLVETRLFVDLSGPEIEIIRGGPQTAMFPHFEYFMQLMSIKRMKVNEIALEGLQLTRYKWCTAPGTSFSSLSNLSMRRCGLTDENLEGLEILTQLETLDLGYNDQLTGSCLMSLPTSLLSLNITGCLSLCPNQLIHLSCMPRLRELRASDPMLGGYWNVYRDLVLACPLLVEVEVSICSVKRDENRLGGLRNLESLAIKAHPVETTQCMLSCSMLKGLMGVPLLRKLMFPDAPRGFVNANALAILSIFRQLRVLIIHNQPYCAKDFTRLKNLKSLETLDLSNSPNITNEIVADLVVGLPNLRVLTVQGCPLLTIHVYGDLAAQLASFDRSMVEMQI
ncbi:uncharacterized protein LOC117147638 [Drosophila mauritiana]|uniref:Uncharacterized protein LOC117147638 n=1 Tax=Drosophila mauritiana TaxID=7226 RepID=A0A6P8KLD8_DROMA|nr:uncharacterized protein LOC117147638 [Drosophila mauritiana]